MTAVARIATERVPDVVLVPAEAIFQRDGAPIVYRLDGSSSKSAASRSSAAAGAGDRRLGRRAGRSHRDAAAGAGDDQEDRMKRRARSSPPSCRPSSALGAAIAIAVPRLPERGSTVPTARVTKGR